MTSWFQNSLTPLLTHLDSHAFLSVVTAGRLAVAVARFVPDLQDDYLTPLLPCFGISLSFYMFAVPFIRTAWTNTIEHMWGFADRLRLPWHSVNRDQSSRGGRSSFTRGSRSTGRLEDGLPRFRD